MYTVLLFYKYVTIKDASTLMLYMKGLCEGLSLTGRIILAEEGVNGTLEGKTEDTERFLKQFLVDKRFKDIEVKKSVGIGNAFPKLSIKVREEIVATKLPKEINPRKKTGIYLKPEELHAFYEEGKDFVVIDMRNSYEIKSGYFDKTIDPGMSASRELSDVVEKLRIYKDKTIVTTCTGGVRCEKMSAYLLHEGFKNVYQLHNGIHSYMEKYPGKNFKGTLYTFDNRRVMDFGGEREIVGRCADCDASTEDYYDFKKENGEENQTLFCFSCAEKKGEKVRK